MKKGDIVFLKNGITEEFINAERIRLFGVAAHKVYLDSVLELKNKNCVVLSLRIRKGNQVLNFGCCDFELSANLFTVSNSKQIFPFEDEL